MASQDDQKQPAKQTPFQSGYIKMSQSNSDAHIYWATFVPKSNQLHLFEQEASLKEPEEVIYLSTCTIHERKKSDRYVIVEDLCTGIIYKFEPYQQNKNDLGWVDKINFFIQECVIDFLCTDVHQMNARQQFNRFLLHQKKVARAQREQLPKLMKAAKKATDCDAALKDATNWLQRQQLDDEDRRVFGEALSVRNEFWNLLIDTRDFLNKDYVTSSKICGVFARWDKMAKQAKKLSAHDKKVLVWRLKNLSQFTSDEKAEKAKELHRQWRQLEGKIVECKVKLQALSLKWEEKVKSAKKFASCCNWIGGFLIAAGAVAGIVAAVASAPAWLPFAAGGAVVAGLGVIGVGQEKLSATKKTKKTIDDMQKHLSSYRDRVQSWTEATELLEIPLGCIGLGDKAATTDYEPEIEGWEKIAEHEKDLLDTAQKTFKQFRDESLKSLQTIRTVQKDLNLQ